MGVFSNGVCPPKGYLNGNDNGIMISNRLESGLLPRISHHSRAVIFSNMMINYGMLGAYFQTEPGDHGAVWRGRENGMVTKSC